MEYKVGHIRQVKQFKIGKESVCIIAVEGVKVLISRMDYGYLKRFLWRVPVGGAHSYPEIYVKMNSSFSYWLPVHRTIAYLKFGKKLIKGQIADHINRVHRDLRRSNIRICSLRQNLMNSGPHSNNTSGYKGVFESKDTRYKHKWMAAIVIRRKQHVIGRYPCPEDAARAYDKVAKRKYGKFAYLNFGRTDDEEAIRKLLDF